MQPSDNKRFHLHHSGRLIEVDIEAKFLEPVAKLLIDGELVDEQSTWPKATELEFPGLKVHVEWTLLSSPQRVWAVFQDEKSAESEDGESDSTGQEHDLTAPVGS